MPDLFNELFAGGETAIRQLVVDRRQENIAVEFKTKANSENGEVTKDDRKVLAIALSALANSMGGTLVWGIDARKNSDGVDYASALKPIANIQMFHSEVTKLISQALMPRHEGIRVEIVPDSVAAGRGYLLIQVERSERRPHRCEFGEKQYFKRVGDSSIAMEHYDIEDSFKRFVVPVLNAEMHLARSSNRSGPEGTFVSLKVSISLRNESWTSARYPYLFVEETSNIELPPVNLRRGVQYPKGAFDGGADVVLHPESSIVALSLEREFRLNHRGKLPRGSLQSPIIISYRCGSLHSRPSFGTFQISLEEVAIALGQDIEPELEM